MDGQNRCKESNIGNILQSGIYIRKEKKNIDLVYGTSDEEFLNWFLERGFVVEGYTLELDIPLSTKEKYSVIKAYEMAGGRIAKLLDEWSEFEERVQNLE